MLYVTRDFLRATEACYDAHKEWESIQFKPVTPSDMVDQCLSVDGDDIDHWGIAHYLAENFPGADEYYRRFRAAFAAGTPAIDKMTSKQIVTDREARQILILGVTSLLRKYYAKRR
jgi:hypothetical protein